MKKKPTGFIAKCQCGRVVGAMDYVRTDKPDAGRIMGKWLADGCTVEPKFGGNWEVGVEACSCNESPVSNSPNGIGLVAPVGRKEVLLRAAYDILKRSADASYMQEIQSVLVRYDNADCDGDCLMEDLANELGLEDGESPIPLEEGLPI